MRKYTVTNNMALQEACIEFNWFTQGSKKLQQCPAHLLSA